MATIEVEIDVRETVKAEVNVRDIIYGMENLPIAQKWAAIEDILDGIKVAEDLTDSQREVVIKFLKNQLDRFEL